MNRIPELEASIAALSEMVSPRPTIPDMPVLWADQATQEAAFALVADMADVRTCVARAEGRERRTRLQVASTTILDALLDAPALDPEAVDELFKGLS